MAFEEVDPQKQEIHGRGLKGRDFLRIWDILMGNKVCLSRVFQEFQGWRRGRSGVGARTGCLVFGSFQEGKRTLEVQEWRSSGIWRF